ncbi:MAG: S8 family serine peptidase, partial [Methylococcales bacterium]
MQSIPVCPATFDKLDYKRLVQIAHQKGFVRVLIGLDVNVSLADLGKQSPVLKLQLAALERAVLDELGDTASVNGRWRSGVGQLEVYVTAEGLKRLAKSRYVRKLMSTTTGSMRATYHDETGTLMYDIEAEIDNNGFAEVEVVLNLENLAYEYTPNGETQFRDSSDQTKELQAKLPLFIGSLLPKHIHNSANAREKRIKLQNTPVQTFQIDREGFLALHEHKDIRAIRLVKSLPKTPILDGDVLETAKATGSAGVLISLYQPFGYSPQVGRLSARAWRSQATTLKETFNSIFLALGGGGAVKEVQAFEGVPSIYAVLSYAALQQLYKSPDARIKRIKLNKGALGSLLSESTGFINMSYAWNHNPQYRGAGQQIVIMDSAFQNDHPFLQQSNGQSKVVFEACFGTSRTVINPINGNSDTFVSLCPLADPITGDSPLGMPNSVNSNICSEDNDLRNLCFHGSYVAGVAVGKYDWSTNFPQWPFNNVELTGMAPDATIIGVSIMSKQTASSDTNAPLPRLWGTYLDIDQAMTIL